ncbi:MAG: helix-turn-helix domain-containing protein [Oligoflexales bacterium]|nr:helix-turn-helix domain-containing protein [Oligoflexales bacterium]
MKEVKKVSELKNSRKERRQDFYHKVEKGTYSLRQAIVAYRYMLGKNQTDFAEFTGVPIRTIQDFEQGKANPTLRTLEKMLIGSGLEISVKRKG